MGTKSGRNWEYSMVGSGDELGEGGNVRDRMTRWRDDQLTWRCLWRLVVGNHCFSSKNAKIMGRHPRISSKNAKMFFGMCDFPARMPRCAGRQARELVAPVRLWTISGVTER